MDRRSFDVIVLGVGGMGSAAAFELARRGRRVLGLEQYALVHDRGSSHGQTRIIRTAYHEHPAYVPLVRRAYQRWYDLEQRTGRHLLTECGLLTLGTPDDEMVVGVRRAAQEHRLAIEALGPDELRRRFPPFRFGDEIVGVLERQAGILYVEDCVRSFIDEARRLGADIREQEPVVSWQANNDSVEVRTGREVYRASRLVISAGAWAGRVLAELGLPLTVTRKALLWFATADASPFRRDVFPIYLASTREGLYYGFPVIDGLGHKTARHDGGDVVADPAEVKRDLSTEDELDQRRFLDRHLPDAAGPLVHHKVCLYTLTPDCHFVIGLHPRHSNVCVAGGFSGHGFKFAPVVGEMLADLAEIGRSELPMEMFRVDRFGGPI